MTTIRITSLAQRLRFSPTRGGWTPTDGWEWVTIDSRWRTNDQGEGLWRWGLDPSGTGVYAWHQVKGTGQFSLRHGSQTPSAVRAKITRRFARYEEITP
jgi:hypothetical protein